MLKETERNLIVRLFRRRNPDVVAFWKLETAKDLFAQGQYRKARRNLVGMDHPTAEKLLAKIDKELGGDGKQAKRPRLRRVLIWATAAVTLLCCVTLLFLPPMEEAPPPPTQAPETATAEAIVAANQTATQAALPTATFTLTPTITLTFTPTLSRTPRPTLPPPPTATPLSPEAQVQRLLLLNDEETERIVVNERVVTVRWYLTDLMLRATRLEADREPPEFMCKLREAGYIEQTYQLTALVRTVDNLGNPGQAEGVEVIIPPELHAQANCADPYVINLESAVRAFEGASYTYSSLLR